MTTTNPHIRAAIERAGLTQNDISRWLRVSPSALSKRLARVPMRRIDEVAIQAAIDALTPGTPACQKDALDFYADYSSYMLPAEDKRGVRRGLAFAVYARPILDDGGRRARMALGEEEVAHE